MLDLQQFREDFCDAESEECNLRVGFLLSFIMLRRTHKDRMFGRPLVNLPLAHDMIQELEFTHEERALYEVLEDKFRAEVNR